MAPLAPHRLADKAEIRRLLNLDRDWSLYALADLDDGLFEHCDWWGYGDALALVFHALAIRPIFVLGDAAATRALLAALPGNAGYLNLKPHQMEAASTVFRYRSQKAVQRMFLDDFRPRWGAVERLGPADLAEVEALYATGDGGGIAFAPFQMESGFFRGIREGGALVAVAGVHVVSRNESVASVGNIFTRPDRRGRGLAQMLASAVTNDLKEAGIRTIGLNVERGNAVAIHAYERVGFAARFDYVEGFADRLPPSA